MADSIMDIMNTSSSLLSHPLSMTLPHNHLHMAGTNNANLITPCPINRRSPGRQGSQSNASSTPSQTRQTTICSMTSTESTWNVNHSDYARKRYSDLFLDEKRCDAYLQVGEERIPISKIIVSRFSELLDEYFFGENAQNEDLSGGKTVFQMENWVNIAPLKYVLTYVYHTQLDLSIEEKMIYEILNISYVYGFSELSKHLADYLEKSRGDDNVLNMYFALSVRCSLHPFVNSLSNYINTHASTIITQDSFFQLSPEQLVDLFSRDEFAVPELDLFKAFEKWSLKNPGESTRLSEVKKCIRMHLIGYKDLLNVVRRSSLKMDEGEILNIAKNKKKNMDLVWGLNKNKRGNEKVKGFRALYMPGKNVLDHKYKPSMIGGTGTNRCGDLFSTGHFYNSDHGYVSHPTIESETHNNILVRLGFPAKANLITMLLLDKKDDDEFSYILEVSLDNQNWTKVADYTKSWCRSWQEIAFKDQVIQYIRISGKRSSRQDKLFCLVHIRCFLSEAKIIINENGIIKPAENVATYSKGARVLNHENKPLECSLLSQAQPSVLAVHKIGQSSPNSNSDLIGIHLSQPYILDKIKLYFPQGASAYRYRVHTSLDRVNFEMVHDKKDDKHETERDIRLSGLTAVSMIKIQGFNAVNPPDDFFKLARLECFGSQLK